MRRLFLIVLLVLASAARGAEFTPDPVDEAAAKRQGRVSWYTSTPVELAQIIATGFTERTGIKVQLFRTGGSAALSRFLAETAAGHVAADVLTMSDAAAARALAERGLFLPFKPEGFDKVVEAGKDPQGRFIAQRMNLIAMMVRSDKVREADWPHEWEDLRDPKYKGMMAMPDPSFTAIQLIVVGTLSHALGWGFYEDLRRNNILIVQGHEQVYDTLKRGERLLAAEAADPRSYTKGVMPTNLRVLFPKRLAILVTSPTAIAAAAPSPDAAKLFVQFMLTQEIQRLFPPAGLHSSRIDVPPPEGAPALDTLDLVAIDYADLETRAQEIKERFNEIFQ